MHRPLFDRAGDRRRDRAWVAECCRHPAARAVLVGPAGVRLDGDELARVALDRVEGEPLLLALEDGAPLFAVDAGDDAELTELVSAIAALRRPDGGLAVYATALVKWHRKHPFCAACGAATRPTHGGAARRCPDCEAVHRPRIEPVVIALVVDGDRVLLGRKPGWSAGRYAPLSGFVEPGESLEDAVARELHEESGVTVGTPRYVVSQPWPFPSSLMVAFVADWTGGEPTAEHELGDVRWFDHGEVSAAAAGRGSLRLPPRLAIARQLIDRWLVGAA